MIRYSRRAVSDVEEFSHFIGMDSPEAGDRFSRAVQRSLALVHESPRIGRRRFRRASIAEMRSWPVDGFPNHLVFYRFTDDGVLVVLRVLHASRRIKAALFDDE